MKGEVEVTFKCEGCGNVLFVSKHNQPEDVWHNVGQAATIGDFTCPKCAKLTYGPITEDDLAAALEEDDKLESYREMARFVLRLLKALDGKRPDDECADGFRSIANPHMTSGVADWRGWLLNLARQP